MDKTPIASSHEHMSHGHDQHMPHKEVPDTMTVGQAHCDSPVKSGCCPIIEVLPLPSNASGLAITAYVQAEASEPNGVQSFHLERPPRI